MNSQRLDIICRKIAEKTTTSAAGTHDISLSDVECEDQGKELCLLGFIVEMPNVAVSGATSKIHDGASLAQQIDELTVEFAPDAPPCEAGGKALVDAVSGFQALHALHLITGKPVIQGYALDDVIAPSTGAADDTDNKTLTSPTVQRVNGALQLQGPFGCGDGTSTFAYSAATRFYLPFGESRREKRGAQAIPMRWFSGQKKGSKVKGSGGRIKIVMGSKIDNVSITWTAGQITIWAVMVRVDPRRVPVPNTMRIVRKQENTTAFKIAAGIQEYFALFKPLTAAGAMGAHTYTRAVVRYDGKDLNDSDLSLDIYRLQNAMPQGFPVSSADDSLTHAGGTRYLRSGVPLLVNCDEQSSALDAPGGIERQPIVKIDGAGSETSYDYLQVTRTPRTSLVNAAAAEYHAVSKGARPEVYPATRNGNGLPPAFAEEWDPFLPGFVVQ